MAESVAVNKYSVSFLTRSGKGWRALRLAVLRRSDGNIRADILSLQDIGRATLSYRSKMKEVSALAHAAGLARRLTVAIEGGWHHGFGNFPSRAYSRRGARAKHFSGGPSRAGGGLAVQRFIVPAVFQIRRALAKAAAARRHVASNLGLALAKAASDNKLIDTDAQVHSCAARTRLMCAGHRQR